MRRGFTLIELLVVITILAVLAGAALPYVQAYVEESRIAKAKTDLEEIARALAVYETREGDYSKADVSDLTGRYLNKAPIDPWGNGYIVDINAGTVYSSGPDRSSLAGFTFDDVIVPYQPPLALVSVKWVDRNQSGAVDTQNVPDQLQLTFSRKLGTPLANFGDAGAGGAGAIDLLFNAEIGNPAVSTLMTAIVDETAANVALSSDQKTVIYNVVGAGVFTPGQDTINVISPPSANPIQDQAAPTANLCISDQPVVILPQ